MNPLEKEIIDCCLDHRTESPEPDRLNIFAKWSFPTSFTGFSGHFTGQPILPAVVQLTLVRLLAEKGLQCSLFPEKFDKTKFRQIVEPEHRFGVELKITTLENRVDCDFILKKKDDTTISNGRCTFSFVEH